MRIPGENDRRGIFFGLSVTSRYESQGLHRVRKLMLENLWNEKFPHFIKAPDSLHSPIASYDQVNFMRLNLIFFGISLGVVFLRARN